MSCKCSRVQSTASWSKDRYGIQHPLNQGSWGLTAHCQSGHQRVVLSGRQNTALLPGAPQVRK
jgi:hypothetical protein